MIVRTHKAYLLAGALLLATAAGAQQPTQDVQPGTIPTLAAQSDSQTPMLTKREMKDQKHMQQQQEKAAREAAKAQKSQASALKHEDKATDAQEKAQRDAPMPAPPPQ
jgi:hypothetical protein